MLQKFVVIDPAGTLEKALERNLLNVNMIVHCLCWTSLLVKSSDVHPIPIKPVFRGVGSVPAGSAQCNNEVNLGYQDLPSGFFASTVRPPIMPL